MPVLLLRLEGRVVDGRMTPFRRVRADLEDAVEVEPDREVIALGAFCGMTVDFAFSRLSVLLVAHLADAAGQMRAPTRGQGIQREMMTDVGIADSKIGWSSH